MEKNNYNIFAFL